MYKSAKPFLLLFATIIFKKQYNLKFYKIRLQKQK